MAKIRQLASQPMTPRQVENQKKKDWARGRDYYEKRWGKPKLPFTIVAKTRDELKKTNEQEVKISKPQRVLVEQESGCNILISTPAWLSLARKAGKNEVPLSVLEQVYARGLLEAQPHPKNTPEQQAFLRVESFLHYGKAYELDEDLNEMCSVPDGNKHMHIIKSAIKRHKERNKPLKEDWGHQVGRAARRLIFGGPKKKRELSPDEQIARKRQSMEIDYRAKQGFLKTHPELEKTQPEYRPSISHLDTTGKVRLQKNIAREIVDRQVTAARAAAIAQRLVQRKISKEKQITQQNKPKLLKGPNDYPQKTAGERRAAWHADLSAEAEKKRNKQAFNKSQG